nr:hypothetical protein [Sphingomonas sp. Y57]
MVRKAFTAEPGVFMARHDQRWHPGACVATAIALAAISWTPILAAWALLHG